MRTGTINNYVKFSKSFGGVRKCYEGKPEIVVGGFSCDKSLMPLDGAAMAAGTPVLYDEQLRTLVPLYTFRVLDVDTEENTIKVEKFETGSIAKVGMNLIVVGDDLTAAAAAVLTITDIDKSASDYDILTVTGLTGGSSANVQVGDILAEAMSAVVKKVKVIPNGLTYCDNVLDNDAYAIDVDPIYFSVRPVLERRMPPLTASLKKALIENGCYFNFSNRK
jgi:hypothetical protein